MTRRYARHSSGVLARLYRSAWNHLDECRSAGVYPFLRLERRRRFGGHAVASVRLESEMYVRPDGSIRRDQLVTDGTLDNVPPEFDVARDVPTTDDATRGAAACIAALFPLSVAGVEGRSHTPSITAVRTQADVENRMA